MRPVANAVLWACLWAPTGASADLPADEPARAPTAPAEAQPSGDAAEANAPDEQRRTAPHLNFAGRYVLVSKPERTRAVIDAAIERAVAGVALIFRSRARDILWEGVSIIEQVTITRSGQEFLVDVRATTFDATPAHSGFSGAHGPRLKASASASMRLSQRVHADRIVQRIVGKAGRRTHTYRLSPDGTQLDLEVEVRNDRLPVPMAYHLIFERADRSPDPS